MFSKYAICRFARQSLVFEIWRYLLTSKAFVSAYDSSKSKAVLSRLPFGLKYRTVQYRYLEVAAEAYEIRAKLRSYSVASRPK